MDFKEICRTSGVSYVEDDSGLEIGIKKSFLVKINNSSVSFFSDEDLFIYGLEDFLKLTLRIYKTYNNYNLKIIDNDQFHLIAIKDYFFDFDSAYKDKDKINGLKNISLDFDLKYEVLLFMNYLVMFIKDYIAEKHKNNLDYKNNRPF